MATAEERMQILKMIQSGQITAKEGARLLEALQAAGKSPAPGQATSSPHQRDPVGQATPRQVRVRVTDLKTGQKKVDIRMPWSLANVGLDMGARFAREEIDVGDCLEATRSGTSGKIVDVIDEENGERVEIFVE